MSFATFIKSISVNSITSIINFNKHWLILLRVNYRHWPWSLLWCEDFLLLYIISSTWDRLNTFPAFELERSRLNVFSSSFFFPWVKCVELSFVKSLVVILCNIQIENAVNCVLKQHFVAFDPFSRNNPQYFNVLL